MMIVRTGRNKLRKKGCNKKINVLLCGSKSGTLSLETQQLVSYYHLLCKFNQFCSIAWKIISVSIKCLCDRLCDFFYVASPV